MAANRHIQPSESARSRALQHATEGMALKRILTLFVLAACDPVATVSGRIEPALGNQLVELKCSSEAKLSIARESRTDSEGAFIFEGLGCVPFGCYVSALGARGPSVGRACSKSARGCAAQTCSEARGLIVEVGGPAERLNR